MHTNKLAHTYRADLSVRSMAAETGYHTTIEPRLGRDAFGTTKSMKVVPTKSQIMFNMSFSGTPPLEKEKCISGRRVLWAASPLSTSGPQRTSADPLPQRTSVDDDGVSSVPQWGVGWRDCGGVSSKLNTGTVALSPPMTLRQVTPEASL